MQFKNSTPFSYGHARTSRKPPQPEIVLVVRAKLRIVPDGALAVPPGIPVESQGTVTGDVFATDDDDQAGECLYASDLADFKRNAEVMLSGTCHVPNGRPVAECPVSFAVGAWSKILRVVGPRTWTEGFLASKPTDPAPFTKMPLRYSHAFGGPAYAANPVGKGFGTPDLPSIERPGEPIESRSDKPAPAGFGPLSRNWPARRNKMAKSKSKLFPQKGSPFYGEDLDWTYFHAAPADQQLQGYLRGDEELVFHNLHPTRPVLRTRLPGVRVRAFIKDAEARFREVPMNLDTLFADMDEEVVYLTWRGLEPVRELDLLDVRTVLFASEPMGAAPLPQEHHREALEAFEREPSHLDEVLPQDQREEVERAIATAKSAKAAKDSGAAADPLSAALDGKLGVFDAKTRDSMKGTLAALMAEVAKQGVDPSAARRDGPAAQPGKGMKGGGLKAALAVVQQRMESLRREAKPGTPVSPELVAYEKLLTDPRLAQAGLTTPAGEAKAPEEPGPGRDLSGQDFTGQDLRGADLTGANLTGTNLTKANLQNANLSGAVLKRAILDSADLTGADLSNADMTEALLSQARAPGANLRGATLTRTIFHEADLTGATLADAIGESPIFSKARLEAVNAQRVRFFKPVGDEATLDRADFSGAEMTQGVFSRSSAKGLDLSDATLDRMSFIGSDLTGAVVTAARGEQTAWLETDLTDADFSFASFPAALWGQAKATRTRFFGANLRQGKFYRAVLVEAEMVKANLFEAMFPMATILRSRFVEANLFDAKLQQVTGADNDFTKANLKQAILEIEHARG